MWRRPGKAADRQIKNERMSSQNQLVKVLTGYVVPGLVVGWLLHGLVRGKFTLNFSDVTNVVSTTLSTVKSPTKSSTKSTGDSSTASAKGCPIRRVGRVRDNVITKSDGSPNDGDIDDTASVGSNDLNATAGKTKPLSNEKPKKKVLKSFHLRKLFLNQTIMSDAFDSNERYHGFLFYGAVINGKLVHQYTVVGSENSSSKEQTTMLQSGMVVIVRKQPNVAAVGNSCFYEVTKTSVDNLVECLKKERGSDNFLIIEEFSIENDEVVLHDQAHSLEDLLVQKEKIQGLVNKWKSWKKAEGIEEKKKDGKKDRVELKCNLSVFPVDP